MLKYDNKDCNKFVKDMIKAGLEDDLRHYNGRWFWTGPAVSCSRYGLQDILSSTKVKCQWDSLGLGYIVYPKSSGQLVD